MNIFEKMNTKLRSLLLAFLAFGFLACKPDGNQTAELDAPALADQTPQKLPGFGQMEDLPYSFARFLDVFNGKKVLGQAVSVNDAGNGLRAENLRALLTEQAKSSTPPTMLSRFLSEMTQGEDVDFFQLQDDDWYAQAWCDAIFKNQKTEVGFTLKFQSTERGNAWGIVGVAADMFDGIPLAGPGETMLFPNAHELNFMRLGHDIEEHLHDLTFQGFQADRLSMLVYLLHSGELKIGSVERLTVHALQYPGWRIQITEQDLESGEGGWRISGLYPLTDEQEKYCFLIDSLHISPQTGLLPDSVACKSSEKPKSKETPPTVKALKKVAEIRVEELTAAFEEYNSQQRVSVDFLQMIYPIFENTDTKVVNDLSPDLGEFVTLAAYLSVLNEGSESDTPFQKIELRPAGAIRILEKDGERYAVAPILRATGGGPTTEQVVLVDARTLKIDCILKPSDLK